MSIDNINQEGFQRRLDVIASILNSYQLEVRQATAVTPVEYEEDCPFPYNNFIYKIELSSPLGPSTFSAGTPRPGTSAPSKPNVSAIIIRLSNPRANGLNNAHRVENEVAAQALFRQHLISNRPTLTHIIPELYAWEPCRQPEVSGEAGFGWTICEFMPGANLAEQFEGMQLSQKLDVIEQVADVLAAVQQTLLPSQLKGHFGGLTFDGQGQIIGGQMSILPGGPWTKYTDLWVSRFRQQLHDADKSSVLKGWEKSGLRARIDRLVDAKEVAKLLDGVDTTQKTLIHGDFTLHNFLYDQTTSRITALLDFDFSWVSHPSHEFFTGLWSIGGGLRSDNDKIITAVLTGKFDEIDDSLSGKDKDKWQVAQSWNAALVERGAIRPASIAGIDRLRQLMELEDALCPSRLGNERAIERLQRQDKLAQAFNAATDKLTALLNDLDS
ncbi:hypothetical protein PFICI_11550 [Pestalotiopsis fici W106-1]|uniref:Aminoglycoside phosphotransferase domain-containing protein n=1 Tax=Pestalotiopsis fici (strain W106-1 / CGMCC3.15140) TaxID=1229662 RepID=W3WQP5_PESFW|nr:uncharacterized protein PFICI_11550 [Pestalotiopsis fici W106-1]ETS76163.1 hypothetical protein PFICI_11550 [Pestalotiopsis fici W106-1]